MDSFISKIVVLWLLEDYKYFLRDIKYPSAIEMKVQHDFLFHSEINTKDRF